MVTVTISAEAITTVENWCRFQVPAHALHQVRKEAEATNRHIDIVERRAPWDGVGEWTRYPVARLAFTATTGLWTLLYRDRNTKFHTHPDVPQTRHLEDLLDYLATAGDPIFTG
jgi:hypothetical protein